MNSSTKNYLILSLALTTLGTGALAWHEFLALVARPIAVESPADYATEQQQLAAAQRRAQELEDQLVTARDNGSAADAPAAAPALNQNSGARGRGNFRAVMNNPTAIRLMEQQQRAALDTTYAPLFKMLNLPPAQLDQLKSLLVEKQSTLQDVMNAARAQGINPRTDPAAYNQLVTSSLASVDASLQAVLGDAAYSEYQQYTQAIPQQNLVNRLQQSLSYSSAPLTDTQSTQLLQVLAKTAPATSDPTATAAVAPTPGGRGGGGPAGGGIAPITDQTIAAAQPILSNTQLEALQLMQQTQQAQQQLRALISSSGGGQTPATSSPRSTKGG